MKKISIAGIALFCLALIVGGAAFVWWQQALAAPSTEDQPQRIVIERGASAEGVAANLAKAGVIKDPFAFKLYVQLNNLTRSIPTGQFDIPRNLAVPQVIEHLEKGPTQLWITFPEGLRREEMAEKAIEGLDLTGEAAGDFRAEFLQASRNQEGYLFPDTYLFPPEVTATKVVQTLLDTFDQKFTADMRAKLDDLEITFEEAVTLASLIERETLTAEERPVVAGILFNRLAIGMPLQVDATVQYAVGKPGNWWTKDLTREQILETDSPYNTYVSNALPPAPIASPGLTSLQAVANPVESAYFYYIHDPSGQIHYAEDLAGHNANVARYLQ